MKPKSWIVIGIILFVIMTLNNLYSWLYLQTEPGSALWEEIWKNTPGSELPVKLLWLAWGTGIGLHIFSVIMIVIGVKKIRNEKLDADIQDRLGFTKPKPAREELEEYESKYVARKPVEKKETSSSCSNCGKPLKPAAKFCGSCGNQV